MLRLPSAPAHVLATQLLSWNLWTSHDPATKRVISGATEAGSVLGAGEAFARQVITGFDYHPSMYSSPR